MENKVKKLIKKLEAENADRKDDLMYSSIKEEYWKVSYQCIGFHWFCLTTYSNSDQKGYSQ